MCILRVRGRRHTVEAQQDSEAHTAMNDIENIFKGEAAEKLY